MEGFHQEKAEVLLKDKFDSDTNKYGLLFMEAFGHRKDSSISEEMQSLLLILWAYDRKLQIAVACVERSYTSKV